MLIYFFNEFEKKNKSFGYEKNLGKLLARICFLF